MCRNIIIEVDIIGTRRAVCKSEKKTLEKDGWNYGGVWQPQIQRIWGWWGCFWSFTIPKLRLRLPPGIEPSEKKTLEKDGWNYDSDEGTIVAGCDK